MAIYVVVTYIIVIVTALIDVITFDHSKHLTDLI